MFKKLCIILSVLLISITSTLPVYAIDTESYTITFDWSDILEMADNGYIRFYSFYSDTGYFTWGLPTTMSNGYLSLHLDVLHTFSDVFLYSSNGNALFIDLDSISDMSLDPIEAEYICFYQSQPIPIYIDLSWLGYTIDNITISYNLTWGFPAQGYLVDDDSNWKFWINGTTYDAVEDDGTYTFTYSGSDFSAIGMYYQWSGNYGNNNYLLLIENNATAVYYISESAETSGFTMTIEIDSSQIYTSIGSITASNDSASSVLESMDAIEGEILDNLEVAWNDIDVNTTLDVEVTTAISTVSQYITVIWDSLGTFQLLITFPLLLALILVVVGRKSKQEG